MILTILPISVKIDWIFCAVSMTHASFQVFQQIFNKFSFVSAVPLHLVQTLCRRYSTSSFVALDVVKIAYCLKLYNVAVKISTSVRLSEEISVLHFNLIFIKVDPITCLIQVACNV